MMNLTNRMMVVAAGAILSVGAAWGQNLMKADIPFAFETTNAKLPAGTYTLEVQRRSGTSSVVVLRSVETRKGVFVVGRADGGYNGAHKPVLQFLCSPATCSLRDIRTNEGTIVCNDHPTAAPNHRLETVALASVHGN